MKDRIPGAPGRYSASLPSGELDKLQRGDPFSITLIRDDAPVVQGTPYSKAAVLPDDLAAKLCPGIADPSPADAFAALERNKAPIGFGLGGSSAIKAVTEITANGWYVTNQDTPTPTDNTKYYLCHSFVTNDGKDITVEAWNLNGTEKWKRTKRNDLWGEWETMLDAIGAYPASRPSLTNADLNDYKGAKKSGTYWCAKECANAPFPSYFYLEVNGNYQRATRYLKNNDGTLLNTKIKCRFYINNEWSEWTEPYVSIDSAGESGRWTYRKWSNGIAECWSKQSVTLGDAFETTISFPFPFVEDPSVTLSAEHYTRGCVLGGIDGYSNASSPEVLPYVDTYNVTIQLFAVDTTENPTNPIVSATGTGDFNVYCVGKWK